jgi:hypothetical protein
MYLNTFEGLGLAQDQLKSSPHPFYRVVPGMQFIPLRQVTLSVTFGDASNYRIKMLAFEVVVFSRLFHIILGRDVTSSSWPSLAMPTLSLRYWDLSVLALWRPRLSGRWTVSSRVALSWSLPQSPL